LDELGAGRYREALRLCAEHHGATLGRLSVAMLGSQAEAEEMAQETLLTAYQSFDAYRGQGSVLGWLCGIARKKCLKQLEHRRRETTRLLAPPPEDGPSAEERLHDKQRAARARAALEAVRPTEREALLLRYAGELSFDEVAQACDVDPALARKRVSRGLARLRKALQDSDALLEERAKA
jgi:RNA polymerase sigma-70 factor (ECF subfamily)